MNNNKQHIYNDEYWGKLRELIRDELARTQKKEGVKYNVAGLTEKPIYKPSEVCEMLQVTRQTLHDWDKSGLLVPRKIKSRSYYLWKDIQKLLGNDD
ncbi:MAG: MerR family transcriptional regulator [Chitinophagaceae bacterium]|nr:MerR family transcriptional regulator [Chitinophagaceae bacterium]